VCCGTSWRPQLMHTLASTGVGYSQLGQGLSMAPPRQLTTLRGRPSPLSDLGHIVCWCNENIGRRDVRQLFPHKSRVKSSSAVTNSENVKTSAPMSDLTKEIIVGSLAVFFTALFTGIPAVMLFWWTWQRDQERLVVQKQFWYGKGPDGKRVLLWDGYGPRFGLLIRNRSLFSVHVDAVGFEIDGELVQLEHPAFPVKLKRNPDRTSNRLNIPDEDSDPYELSSGASEGCRNQDRSSCRAVRLATAVHSLTIGRGCGSRGGRSKGIPFRRPQTAIPRIDSKGLRYWEKTTLSCGAIPRPWGYSP